jgi:peptidoglycan glycosyltransferase
LRLRRLTVALLCAFLAVGSALVVWSIIRAPQLASRPDNPRLVESELRIRRGSIWDSDNAIIAETAGPMDTPQRVYPLPAIGPAVGYYSYRHGTAGLEQGYDAVLRGDSADEWVNLARETLHLPQDGRDIRATLDADWQRVADTLLGEQQGAVVLLTVPDGAIRAMVSHPGYDPNQLDAQFDSLVSDENAPLLNRAAQSQYQPGMALQPFVIAGALEEGLITLDESVLNADQPVAVDGQSVECDTEAGNEVSWADVLVHRCPGPMTTLGEALGAVGLDQIFSAFRMTQPPELPIETQTPPVAAVGDPPMATVGQENLVVTPLQMIRALASLVAEGKLPAMQLVTAVEDENGEWVVEPPPENGANAISAETAEEVFVALPQHVGAIAEHIAAALTGPAGEQTGWYLGVAPAADPRYIAVVVVEDDPGATGARRAGRALLEHILGAEVSP